MKKHIKYIATALIPLIQGCIDGNFSYQNKMPNHLYTFRQGYKIPIGSGLEAYAAVDDGTGVEVKTKNFYGVSGYFSEAARPNSLKKILREVDKNGDKEISTEEEIEYDLKRSGFK